MIRLLCISRFLPYHEGSAWNREAYAPKSSGLPRLPADRLHLPIRVVLEWKREQARMNGERLERRG